MMHGRGKSDEAIVAVKPSVRAATPNTKRTQRLRGVCD